MKYKANLYVQEWHTIEIEADSAEEAHDKALEDGLDGEPTYVEVDLLDINKQDGGSR
jgi:hypothetical protein